MAAARPVMTAASGSVRRRAASSVVWGSKVNLLDGDLASLDGVADDHARDRRLNRGHARADHCQF